MEFYRHKPHCLSGNTCASVDTGFALNLGALTLMEGLISAVLPVKSHCEVLEPSWQCVGVSHLSIKILRDTERQDRGAAIQISSPTIPG